MYNTFLYKFGVQIHRKICRIYTTNYLIIITRCRHFCIENLVVAFSNGTYCAPYLPELSLPTSVNPYCALRVAILSTGCFLLMLMTNSNNPSNALPVYKYLRWGKALLSSQAGSIARTRPDGSFVTTPIPRSVADWTTGSYLYQRGHGISEIPTARRTGEPLPPQRSRNKTSSYASARIKNSGQIGLGSSNRRRDGGSGSSYTGPRAAG